MGSTINMLMAPPTNSRAVAVLSIATDHALTLVTIVVICRGADAFLQARVWVAGIWNYNKQQWWYQYLCNKHK